MKQKWIAPCIFLAVSTMFMIPLLSHITWWGGQDWDQHFFYHEAPRKTILEYGQFPLWNPWYCGGTALLANPQSVFMAPQFIFVLLFGAVIGIKLQAVFMTALGMWGMWLLARHLKFSSLGSYGASLIFFLGSWYALRIVSGHSIYLAIAYLPFAFLFFLKGFKHWRYALLSGVMITLMYFSGAAYPVAFTVMFLGLYGILIALKKRKMRPLILLGIVAGAFLLTSAVKLIPMVSFLSDYGWQQHDSQYYGGGILWNSFFSRNQGILTQDKSFYYDPNSPEGREAWLSGKLPWGWHEYGSYIGFLVLALVLFSLRWWRHLWHYLLILGFFFWTMIGKYAFINLSTLLFKLPLLRSLHGPSRFNIMVMFLIALLAGFSLTRLQLMKKWGKIIAGTVLALVIIDLGSVSMPLLADAFTHPPPSLNEDNDQFFHIIVSDPYTTQYPNLMQNMGTANCYERLHPEPSIIPLGSDDGTLNQYYAGEAFLVYDDKPLDILFSPNAFHVLNPDALQGLLELNQNFAPGWRSSAGRTFSSNGRVGVELSSQETEAVFRYLPGSFVVGAIITLLSIAVIIFLWWKR
ncbi:MAG: hypothetical protein ABIH34_00025 [Nanoarchaeota archaeon]